MASPKMILFDYGHTLVYEPLFDRKKGFQAVLGLCAANPGSVTPEELDLRYKESLARLMAVSRSADCDFQDMAVKRMLYESAGLAFSADEYVLERVFWDAAGPGIAEPGIRELLEELGRRGIRTAVLSNMNFRGKSVKGRIDRLLPENSFEFVLCSCEYATRKPRPDFFRLALAKAGLEAEEVWYCGDNPRCDVLGARAAGLKPVWFDPEEGCPYRPGDDDVAVAFPCLHIRHWNELLNVLNETE